MKKYKQNRFIHNYGNKYNNNAFMIYDTFNNNKWFVNYNINNSNDNLGELINNLYNRNSYLRAEASKQFHRAEEYENRWLKEWKHSNGYFYLFETVKEIIDYRELPDILEFAEIRRKDPQQYYDILFNKPLMEPRFSFDDFKNKLGDFNENGN